MTITEHARAETEAGPAPPPLRVQLPSPECAPAEHLRAMCAERDRLLANIAAQRHARGDMAGLITLTQAADRQRRQLQSSRLRESRLVLQEIVRHAERAVWASLEAHREAGLLIRRGGNAGDPALSQGRVLHDYGISGGQIGKYTRLYRRAGDGGLITDDEFVQAIERCRTRGDISRAPLIAELGSAAPSAPIPAGQAPSTPRERLAVLRQLVSDGHNSHQIAAELNLDPGWVRVWARQHGIEIPGEPIGRKMRRSINVEQSLDSVVTSLQGIASSLEMLSGADFSRIPEEKRAAWLEALQPALITIKRLPKELI